MSDANEKAFLLTEEVDAPKHSKAVYRTGTA
jgi:hypothetical protein